MSQPAEGLAHRPARHFADRLSRAMDERRSCLSVGLDPVLDRLPPEILAATSPGAPGSRGHTARAAAAFGLFLDGVIEAVRDLAVAVKPNVAFFERYGAPGWDCLCGISRKAREAGLLVIADAKRGDIGSTAEAYADALLGTLPDTPGPWVDAVTVNPYLGSDSLEPFLRAAEAGGRGLFVLVRTSNRSAGDLQDLDCGGMPLYIRVAEMVRKLGESLVGESGLSSVGAVVGATAPREAARLREALPGVPFLVPGYGAQGAGAADLLPTFLPGGRGAVINASRSILYAYESREGPWRSAVRAAASEAREDVERVRDAAR